FLLARDQMADMERKIRALFRTVGDLGGFERRRVSGVVDTHPALPAIPDPDRLASVVRHFASLWLTFLAVIYVPDLPISVALIMIVNSISMMLSSRLPYVPVPMLFKPIFAALLFAGLMHIGVMPHLSGFAGLGTMIFAATFVICYWNAEPQQNIGRSAGLALLCSLTSITNDQSYSFLHVVNFSLVFVLFFGVLIVTTHVPISFRPERVCLRMLARFFRSASFLLAARGEHALFRSGWWHRRQVAFHLQEVNRLPQKLAVWQRVLPKAALGSTPPEKVQMLISGLQDLSYRIQALFEVRRQPPQDAVLNVFLEDIQTWIAGIQAVFDRLAQDPGSQMPEDLRERLAARLQRFEGQIEERLAKPDAVTISSEDGKRMYRLLGAYRGVSKTAVDCAASARAIDWTTWREERFSW
ncbi:MAG: FUSC family protein, partial [Desulfobacterales bacterium]